MGGLHRIESHDNGGATLSKIGVFPRVPSSIVGVLIATIGVGAIIGLLPLDRSIPFVGSVLGLLLVAFVSLGFSIPFDEMALLFLLIGTVTFERSFSYLALALGEFPVYVTELVMGVLIALVFFRNASKTRIRSAKPIALDYAILAYLLLGAFSLIRTISLYRLEALRDFAIVYYSIFYFLVIEVLQTLSQLRRLMAVFIGSAAFVAFLGIYNIISGRGEVLLYGVVRYLTGHSGMYLVLAATMVLCLHSLIRPPRLALFTYLLCTAGILITAQRSVWLAFASAVVLVGLLDIRAEIVPRQLMLRAGFVIGLFALLVYLFSLLQNEVFQFITNSTIRFLAGFVGTQEDPTSSWRLAGWEQAISSFGSNPAFGTGFGASFDWYWEGILVTNRPHNTYLTVLVKTGMTGLVAFLLILVSFYFYAFRAFSRANNLTQKAVFLALIGSHLSLSVFGFFNLLLESPYMGIFFWGIMGVLVALEQRRLILLEVRVNKTFPEGMI